MENCKFQKSPLKYPGGKSRAIKNILPILLHQNIKTLCSPFIGGASIELACNHKNIIIYGYDVFEPLVDFWQILIKNPKKITNKVMRYHPLKKEKFYSLQKKYPKIKNKFKKAAIFYVLNRSSFSATTFSGGMSPGHRDFSLSLIRKLSDFKVKNFTVKKSSFEKSIIKHKNDFLYLDPPYANGQSLYGKNGNTHKNFDHEILKNILVDRDRWILSYNNSDYIRSLYQGYETLSLDWKYGLGSNKKSNEILILSKDCLKLPNQVKMF